jgi:hypothetical protein
MTEDEHQSEPRAPHDLVYKVHAQNDEAPPPADDGELPEFWTEIVGQAISEYVAPFRQEFATKLGDQQREIAELRAQLSDLKVEFRVERGVRERLQRADVIDLPKRA